MENLNTSLPATGDTLRYIIESVFLPAKVPETEEPDIPTKDSALITEILNAATMFQSTLSEEPGLATETKRAWDIVCTMLKAMHSVRPGGMLAKSSIELGLRAMKVGDVLPIYIPSQNAGVIFRKPTVTDLSFESFEISLPNEVVMGTIGKVVVQYPANPRILIPANDELFSTLADAISFFGSQHLGEVFPVITKAGAGHENVRDTASPRYITEALAGFLRGVGSVGDSSKDHQTIFIEKRIDDRVVFGAGKAGPWRRSSMWLLLRVSLQTTLEELGMSGGAGYKAFQAYLMAHLLQRCTINFDVVPDDLLDAMNRKLARRMWKLKDFVNTGVFPTLGFASSVIGNVATTLKTRWDEVRKQCVNTVNWIAPTQPAIQASLELSLQTNQKYLKSVVERTQTLAQSTNQYDDAATTRALIAACSDRLNLHNPVLPSSINTKELDLGLMDFESWVESHLPSWSGSSDRLPESDCISLSAILEAYAQHGSSHYTQIPERLSVFWLTMAELWVALDRLIVKWNALMDTYSPEIPHDFLDPLLLPSVSQLKRLDAVQAYLRKRHDSAQSGASLFGEISLPQSFQNVYFSQSHKMQEEKRKIEQWGCEEKERTLQEMRAKNEEHKSLMDEYSRLSCHYYTYRTQYGDYSTSHSWPCRKCNIPAEAARLETSRFEDPLPEHPHYANSLVFELNCPEPFGLWREATYRTLLHAFSHSQSPNRGFYALKSYTPTNRFLHSEGRSLTVDSSVTSIASSFLGDPCRLPTTPKYVTFPHSGQYELSYDGNWLQTRGESVLRPLCTLRLDKPYESLTGFMVNTMHSPNSVIASQVKCPTLMSLGEYLAFGHLRSGNEIQLRNIARSIVDDSLSLNEPGVHSLFIQTIWQAGPNKIAKSWHRDAHEDLLDTKFSEEMLVVLNESLDKVGESGREFLHLATLTALATRMLSLTQQVEIRKACLLFLERARNRASDWMVLAETEVALNTNDDSGRLQHKMALIAVVWRLTFDVDAEVLEILCRSPANISVLLFTKMIIATDSTQFQSLSSGIQLLLRRDKHFAYRVLPYIASALKDNCEPLHEATHRVWDGYHRGSQWAALPSHGSRWWKCATSRTMHLESRSVCVNTLSGEMLVDGKTPNRLPPSYISHDTYKNLFDKSVSLRSRPSTMRGMEYEAKYRGRQLHFAMIAGFLIVRLLRGDVIEEFVPRDQIRGDVSSFLLQEQFHWYIEEGGRRFIEFRPLKEGWNSSIHKNWVMDLNESVTADLQGMLHRKSSFGQEKAMDPHSGIFSHLHHSVKGVERHPLNMHVVVTTRVSVHPPLLDLKLPNRDLDFFVNSECSLESRTFPHYILDTNQDINCFYGLVDCLVLCDSSPSQRVRKVVVPRGRIEAVKSSRNHPVVHVEVFGKVGTHVFDVDNLVGRLLGNCTVERDLFLIQLHAYTASHCPDPLTNRTGTEESLELLESFSLLSHHIPSEQWRDQLDQIAAISPRREYYPHWSKAMEKIRWNANLPVASQHPEFERRITRILSYWADIDVEKSYLGHTRPSKPASVPGLSKERSPGIPSRVLCASSSGRTSSMQRPGAGSKTLLSRLSLQFRVKTRDSWIVAISLYATQIISVQQSRRLLHYGTQGLSTEFNREVLHGRQRETLGHPDSLLVEIDADICIRSDQMNIAEAMVDPSEGKNTVMQLNMGEGKSSVIVPVVAAALANTEQLVRVVVLKPQSKLQLSLLRGRLSRLANRRIICLPFSRDLKVDMATAQKISRILEACRTEGAIWLCQPEHLLSFKLLGLDLAMRAPESLGIGSEMIKCQLWMQENTRDILDESDEILHTRHQLVYTVGSQTNFDAAPARWEVVQQLLALMHSHVSTQSSPHFLIGASSSPGQFRSIRMMLDEGNELFHELATKIVYKAAIPSIRMANLPTKLKIAAVRLLTQCKIPPLDPKIRSLELHCQENDEQLMWQSLLIVRGLIAFSILPLALQNKRWRVDYGHDLRRSQLAVPYRAKDSPSLRSDFAHPDVLVLLTCLTYYYSGLDDSMIVKTVKELLKLDNPELVYEQWIASCRGEVPAALHKFSGVNVDDDKMIVQSLSPFIGHNKLAIDFFLNRCVFPKEAKEFPYKMSTSGWDLAMRKANPTTGFSGTNDSRFLLPTSIVQADSSAQRHTNATVLAHILQEENSTVVPHPTNLTSKQILDTIFALDPQPTVLLDVGAQILDCSNEDLVKLWLSMYDEGGPIKAAVFFDDDDNMCIMEYDGAIQGFADSPYSTRLNECLVYLDDSHTRGTDLKLPACRAAVTLGPRLPKDKLVQGCMRMRKLGSQHLLVFLAPIEVIEEVKRVVGDDETVVVASHVLLWAMKETCRQLQVNVANWAMQGYEFAARQIGWGQMSSEVKGAQEMQDLFCQEESRSLERLYGIGERKSARERAGHTLSSINENPMLNAIEEHCKLFESFSFDDARTQEEQEVELVHEQEVEREVERPPAAAPASHFVHPDAKHFASTGILVPNSLAFRTVQRSFEHASLGFPSGGTSVFSNLIVTDDFYHTIQNAGIGFTKTIDDFLRPLEWVVTSQAQERLLLVAFSPYEVNQLLSVFRTSKKTKLHLFAPRTSLGMRSLEDLQLFTLPTNLPNTPIPSPLSQQLNLYSGTLYLRDIQSYHGIRKALRLHFGDVAAKIADRGVINSNGFVKDQSAREELGLVGDGFEEDPVQFFRKLFHLRRNGRSFLPSHLGQILFGIGLPESTFEQERRLE